MTRDFGLSELLFVLGAMRWTILLSLIAFACGCVIGLLVAVLRTVPFAPLRWLMTGYIQLFQGTPVLMQLFIAFYGIAVLFGVQLSPWPAVTIAFTLYAAAFLGEIWRGCIQAIPRGQWEAGRSLALNYADLLRFIILPQAFRIAIAPTVGFMVQLIKGTSIAAIIGFIELTRAGQLMVNVTFQPMIVYPVIACCYFALCWPLSVLSQRLEKRIDAGLTQNASV
ncbi:MAG: amino acid ABC transporter permease [Alphaproteobacteria bacterium]|nr:amino acid ABC transporter permease [Alphaproteobacteria bacterium]